MVGVVPITWRYYIRLSAVIAKKLKKRKEKIVLINFTIAIKNYLTIVNSLFGIKGNLNAHLY